MNKKRGKQIYKELIYSYTGLVCSPKELYEYGLSEIIRIKTEMEKIKTEMGYSDMNLLNFKNNIILKPIKNRLKSFKNLVKPIKNILNTF